MKRLFILVLMISLCAASLPGHAKRRTGYWYVTQVPAAGSPWWVDLVETVDSSGVYSEDVNTGDVGANGEFITSMFAEPVAGIWSLSSESQGRLRWKLEWMGEDPVPETITYDYWFEAVATAGGPDFDLASYNVAVDGVLGTAYFGTNYVYVIATDTKTHGAVTFGSSTVYVEPPGFINNITASGSYGLQVTCTSAAAISVHP